MSARAEKSRALRRDGVVVHNDIVRLTPDGLPSMLDYRCHAAAHSIYNTPPVFAIHVTMLVARWLRREIGGLAAMEAINRAKAARLYAAIDSSGVSIAAARLWRTVR